MTESVFVTGAARGIGLAVVRRFACAGYTVGAVDVDEVSLAALKAEAVQKNWSVWTSPMDVTDYDAWQSTLRAFVEAGGGRLDILVNNAGVLAAGQFADIPAARHKRIVDIDVTGVIYGCHAAFPYLRDTARARVLNMCSASAIYGQPELASYSASKFAVRGLTEALELEWRPHDIAVMALWPLFVDTGMIAGVDTGTTRSLGVHLTPDEVAGAAWDALHRRSPTPKVHFPVGSQTKTVYYLSQLSPAWLSRLINKRMAH
ncbi:SDR family oxidoreductase [Mycobacterium sp.]|uniref:SDR family oxidoreductase n=1 Tax=Mycobacterium sp. TaxID=1785 RepID=UPI002CD503BB|nr:SDR family oxidoreductase [Mycobacterium sp.]HME49133.1 SDR family oxidoreductase [Mycobacterium sp.]